jgi:hypothetical protein
MLHVLGCISLLGLSAGDDCDGDVKSVLIGTRRRFFCFLFEHVSTSKEESMLLLLSACEISACRYPVRNKSYFT